MRNTLSVAAILLGHSLCATAVEGMWTPDQLPTIAGPLKAAGLELDPQQFADLRGQPMGAIVSLGGCSASFVSPDGLVVTNHHCAYGAIQLNSTEQRNLLRDGFSAPQRSDELSAGPAARIYVTREIRDVTRKVTAGLNERMTDRQRHNAIDAASKRLTADCEKEAGQRCTVSSFFGGLSYRMQVQLEIKDVRLVYAPPEAIGAFGGEIDNWTWPRHTGDFAFYRAYVGADGLPAPFAEDNVPYRPTQHLQFASQPLADGDFVMLAGYPGSTSRYRLADEIAEVVDWTYPQQIARLSELMDIVNAQAPAQSDVAIKYASTLASWKNVRKNYSGQLDGFARAGAVATKRANEQALLAWLDDSGSTATKAKQNYHDLRAHLAAGRANRERELVMATLGSSGLFAAARSLHRLSIERERPDAAREAGYQQRDEPRIEASLRQLDRRFDANVDRLLVRHALRRYIALPSAQHLPELDDWLGAPVVGGDEPALDARLDALYAGTRLGDLEQRLQWLRADRDDIESSDDSFLQWLTALSPALLRIEDERKAYEGGLQRLLPGFMQAMLDYRRSEGLATYPDANGTLRITFGNVGGVSPRDGLAYLPFTHGYGILEKHTGTSPFDATAAQLARLPAASDLVVNFLADLDVTGGNSGSATLNSRGELVGLVFDMTWESVASNWVFNPQLTRTIHLDQRYLRWIIGEVYPAPALVQELGLRPAG